MAVKQYSAFREAVEKAYKDALEQVLDTSDWRFEIQVADPANIPLALTKQPTREGTEFKWEQLNKKESAEVVNIKLYMGDVLAYEWVDPYKITKVDDFSILTLNLYNIGKI
jgi:hypothetical protein